MKRYLASAGLFFAAVLMAGCTSQAGSGPADVPVYMGPAVESRATGEESGAAVTGDEYEAAYAKFADCMAESDAHLVATKTFGSVHYFSYPSGSEAEYSSCYAPFAAVDREWQLLNEYDNPTQVAFRECLEDIGITPEKTVLGVWDQIQQSKIDPVACTTTAKVGP
ncbi:UNVERIFIED_CONTAM: hypothetical protein OHV15_05400 [Microbacterium sp. SLM126]